MKQLSALFFLLCSLVGSAQIQVLQYDVCVYGGTSAGVIAAYSASKMGKAVLLVEPGTHLGGLTSGGLGYTDIGNKYAITGLALDFYRRMGKAYGKFEQWIFEPHVAEKIFKDYIKQSHVVVLYQFRVRKASKDNGLIKEVTMENSVNPSSATDKVIVAKVFIDCSYEGDLMARAGVSYFVGRESNGDYHETYNGVQLMEGHQFPHGIDPYKIPGDSTSGLIWGISKAMLRPTGTGDKKVQAYNYRICLTNNPKNMRRIERPQDYDSSRYELILRLFEAQSSKRTLNDYFFFGEMPHHKTDINNRGGFSTDVIGMNYDYPDAGYDERRKIVAAHENYTKGLLYFFGHDARVPSELRNEMLQYGYPKDEYVDNDNWSPQLYIRESRRMIGSYVMTQANCEGRETVDDGIGMAAYTMDSHNCERIVVNGMVQNEGNVEIGGFGPYPISYHAIVPKEQECKNLFVPVCLSATHIAYGSIRMEPVFMELAESAAVAACMAIDQDQVVQRVDAKKVSAYLKANPLLDGKIPEVVVDNDDNTHVNIVGDWKKTRIGGYGPSFYVTVPSADERLIEFKPEIKVAGDYSIYAYLPQVDSATAQIQFIVTIGNTRKNIFIKSDDLKVEGQTSGEWVELGQYKLRSGKNCAVTITNRNATGKVVGDAILFVPQENIK